MSSRSYVGTLYFDAAGDFNANEHAIILAETFPAMCAEHAQLISYGICSVEECPSTLRMHWQLYLELRNKIRATGLMAQVPWLRGAHLSARLGTRDEARDYCKKPASHVAGPFEYGEWKRGKTTTLNYIPCMQH